MQKDTLQKAKYRKELQDQIILEEQNKRFQYEEFLREKKMLDDIVQRIHDENERFKFMHIGICLKTVIFFV